MQIQRGLMLFYLALTVVIVRAQAQPDFIQSHGAIIRGDTGRQQIALIFSGHDYNDGTMYVLDVLNRQHIQGSFFFTGDFYRNPENRVFIRLLRNGGHYLGAHSDKHLLYCDWSKRDSLLVSEREFKTDLLANYAAMDSLFGIKKTDALYFLPPYEWYNQTIAEWTSELGLTLINMTPGTLSNADYTTPGMDNYRSSETIWESIIQYEREQNSGLNGFMLLIHPGTAPERTDKFYYQLDELIDYLKSEGYRFVTVDTLLK